MLESLEAFIYDFSGVVATTTLNHSAVLSPHCSVHSATPARTLGVKFFSVQLKQQGNLNKFTKNKNKKKS